MKKNYVKPDVEHIAFYSDEDIATVLPLMDYPGDITGNLGSAEGEDNWT